jgi:methylated-DNA-[protein]-cysteine S-methyltransferase
MGVRHTVTGSPIGDLTLVADGAALIGLYFDGHSRNPRLPSLGPLADSGFEDVIAQLGEYFAGTRTTFEIPLALHGTPFQNDVWRVLGEIPYAETITYGELADLVGRPRASRAVGQANGANPLPIVVPCHRVVASGQRIGGYGGGLETKRKLLTLEGVLLT